MAMAAAQEAASGASKFPGGRSGHERPGLITAYAIGELAMDASLLLIPVMSLAAAIAGYRAGRLLRGPLTHCASCARVAAGCVTQDHGTDEPGEPGTFLRTYAGRRRRRRRWLAPRERASHPSRTDRAKVVCPTPCFAARDWRVSRSSLWRRTAICSVRAGRIARSRSSRSPANSSTL